MDDNNTQPWPAIGRRQLGQYTIWVTTDGLSISSDGVDIRFTPAQTLEIMRLIQFKRDTLEREAHNG